MKKPLFQHITEFTFGSVIPLVLAGGSLFTVGYFCTYEHRLENAIVQESEPDCGNDEYYGEFCWEEIEVNNHWKCFYLRDGHLEPSTKLEYVKWERGFRLPLLECDMILEYKISNEENIYD